MNNDYLRVNSKSDDPEIVDSEFDVEEPKLVPEKKKVTFMTILFSGKRAVKGGITVDLPLLRADSRCFCPSRLCLSLYCSLRFFQKIRRF